MTMTDLETIVLQMLLAGDHPALTILRQQLSASEVSSREYTGVGFFTHFSVSSNAPILAQPTHLRIGDVYATIAGLQHEAGFILYIREGRLHFLECFIVDKHWPKNAKLVEAFYRSHEFPGSPTLVRSTQRDFQNLYQVLAA